LADEVPHGTFPCGIEPLSGWLKSGYQPSV
jgi:hypothetical protein